MVVLHRFGVFTKPPSWFVVPSGTAHDGELQDSRGDLPNLRLEAELTAKL